MSLCYHGFTETPGDTASCPICNEIAALRGERDNLNAQLQEVIATRDRYKATLENIVRNAKKDFIQFGGFGVAGLVDVAEKTLRDSGGSVSPL